MTKLTPEDLLLTVLDDDLVVDAEGQYRFHPERKWRFDLAWPQYMVAAEVEGGVFVRGRHVSPQGFIKDCEKYNAAAELGWSVFRFPVHGKTWAEEAAALLQRVIEEKRQCRKSE